MAVTVLNVVDSVVGFIQPIMLLFIILDPIGNAPFFYVLTKDFPSSERRRVIKESVIAAMVILLVFAIVGDIIMSYLGITVGDFKVAAGLVLLIYSVLGLLEVRLMPRMEKSSLAIVPMATPLLAGPGAIAATIYIKYSWGIHIALAAIIINTVLALPILLVGDKLEAILGKNGTLILDKIMSLIMAAFAIAIIRDGIREIILSLYV